MNICCLQNSLYPSERLSLLSGMFSFPEVETLEDVQSLGADYYFTDIDQVLSLSPFDRSLGGALFVDFCSAQQNYRRHTSGIKQDVAKAVACKSDYKPSVLDVTAGLGADAFVLASLGCQISLLERSAIVYALLEDGFHRALASSSEASSIIAERMQLLKRQDALGFLQLSSEKKFDVVYLDPMFPERKKTAKVKKAMQYFHHIVGEDSDQEDALFSEAMRVAKKRVVVKRPKQAPLLTRDLPSYQIKGKSIRYDIYLTPVMTSE